MRRLRLAGTHLDPASAARDHHPGLHGGCHGVDCRLVLYVLQFDVGPGVLRVESSDARAPETTKLTPLLPRPPTARLAERSHLDVELRKAHVIVIVYSIDQPASFDRLSAWWLPYIRQQGVNVSRAE